MKFSKIDIILIIIITQSLITYNFWEQLSFIPNFFSKSQSLFICMISYLSLDSIRIIFKYNGITIFLSYLLFFFSLNNLLDNMFFDPFVKQWNEYLFAIIALIASYFITRKQTQNAKI